jgi:hypothetical protein
LTVGSIIDRDPEAPCVVVSMFGGGKRDRGSTKGSINPMQGPSGKYPGDRLILDGTVVTVQIHHVDIKGGLKNVPTLAIHVPTKLRPDDVMIQGS